MHLPLLLLIVASVTVAVTVAAFPTPFPAPLVASLDSVSRVTDLATGELLFSNTSGHVNIEYGVPMQPDSRFMIGSNSKLYTTVALYQLQEAGKVNLTSNVADLLDATDFANFGLAGQTAWCPQLPGNASCQKITIHQLLAMTSGMYPQLNYNPDLYAVSVYSIGVAVGFFINNPLIFMPGTKFVYTNPNFILSAYLVEKFSGMTFKAYVKEFISDVIGQKHTSFDLFAGEMGPTVDAGRTTEYYKFFDNSTADNSFPMLGYGRLQTSLNTGAVSGTGGIISTADDERKLWQVLFNKTGKGAPLLKDPKSQSSILFPWTLTGLTQIHPGVYLFNYYTQGLGILCADEGCPSGPEIIYYTGGTFGSTTSNGLAYGAGCNMTMAQWWTSSVTATNSKANYEAHLAQQTGRPLYTARAWNTDAPQTPFLKWLLLDQYTTCTVGSVTFGEAARALAEHEQRTLQQHHQ